MKSAGPSHSQAVLGCRAGPGPLGLPRSPLLLLSQVLQEGLAVLCFPTEVDHLHYYPFIKKRNNKMDMYILLEFEFVLENTKSNSTL